MFTKKTEREKGKAGICVKDGGRWRRLKLLYGLEPPCWQITYNVCLKITVWRDGRETLVGSPAIQSAESREDEKSHGKELMGRRRVNRSAKELGEERRFPSCVGISSPPV